jgi:hypothetical protein
MGIGKKKGGSSFNAGLAKQQPAAFGAKKVGIPLKKGGSVSCYKDGGKVKHDDAAQDKKLISKMIAADKKEAPMKKSYSANGNMVKKLPIKLAAGGAAKDRRGGFDNIKHQPKPKK